MIEARTNSEPLPHSQSSWLASSIANNRTRENERYSENMLLVIDDGTAFTIAYFISTNNSSRLEELVPPK